MENEGSVWPGSSVKIIIKDNKTSAEKLVVIKKKERKKHECFAIVAL